MNKQSEYICPICGEDSMCTDFTDGFKWGRAYCNSCDCGGPEVRTGYDENLDAPWREEARKQFVDVVNEHVSKRFLEWVETTERLPTESNDTAGCGKVFVLIKRRYEPGYVVIMEWVDYIIDHPEEFAYWMPVPPMPEVTE